MSEQLKEWLPNPTFVDYQVPHDGQGADFYDEEKMLEYGRRIVQACANQLDDGGMNGQWARSVLYKHFGVEE
jgi:hypothetical protein